MNLPEKEIRSPDVGQDFVTEVPDVPEIPPEIEKAQPVTGSSTSMQQPVTDDGGRVVLDDPSSQQVTITLPMTTTTVQMALKAKISESIRWFGEWIKRLAEMTARGRFIYRLQGQP